ncbi:reprolysin-like metallopeptidase [Flavobacterium sp.]|uniref:zinc-dependent metalloprotease n=1 Tax=Flavobacterium sp. TaxID=239 RepID=UPI0039E4C8F4
MKKLILLIALVCSFVQAQSQGLWRSINNEANFPNKMDRNSHPREFKLFALDLDALKSQLAQAPKRGQGQQSNVIVSFPNADGQMGKFRIFEAPVLAAELGAEHPGIKSYVGKGIDDPTATIRFSVTLFGLHTMTFSAKSGTTYIDTYTKDLKNYIVYSRSSLTSNRTFQCGVTEEAQGLVEELSGEVVQMRANNSLFKTYRLAMACTIEYAAFHVNAAGLNGGTIAQKKDAVLAAMNVTMTRVNGIYENEFSLTMVIVPNNLDIIFITSDEFDNANTNNILLTQSQTVIDAAIGSANYDIGHTVSTGGGGVANLQSPCTASKARGLTGLPSPVGDPYDVDYVCHEMGHQFGCHHTFNGDLGACNGNRSNTSSFEPGSGSTIMGYTGLCESQNITVFSDPYFHARSLLQAATFINGTGNCAEAVPNGNTPPTVEPLSNHTIPYGTAFVLTGSATDPDGDALTYCWEQYNPQVSVQPPLPTNVTGPNFRSLLPSPSPTRYFPKFSDVLANNLTPTWEVVPNVMRQMIFSLTVRDNGAPMGGQTERETMTLNFANTGPFKVLSQSALEAWVQNSSQVIAWDVAGTTENGINTALVNIRMSADGGLTWPYLLAENTPNDGSETITAPDLVSTNCRVMVEAVGNVFYAVNSKAFAIGYEVVNTCNTYTFDTPFALNDGSASYTVKTIAVPAGTGTIIDVNVHYDITHPNIQNLNLAVIRPGGLLTPLYNQQCASGANVEVTFDSEAPAFACGSGTLNGTMALPTGTLAAMNGFSQQGTWQFGFRDLVAGNAGTVNSFSVEICNEGIIFLSDKQFQFQDFALFPNPNNGDFNVKFRSNSTSKINIAVHDMRGRMIFDQSYDHSALFDQTIKLNNAQAGVYLVSIADGDHKIVKRIVIE